MMTLVALSGCRDVQRTTSLPDYKESIQLSTGQTVAIFSLVRQALMLYPDMEKALSIPLDRTLPAICDKEIFVTIFHEASPQITGVGLQGCVQERILRAVVNLTNHPNFKKYYMLNLASSACKIDIITRRQALDFEKPIKKIRLEQGIEGLILQNGERMFYQLPTDYIHFGWEPLKRGKGIRQERLKIQLDHLCRQANLGSNGYKKQPVYKFRTRSYLQHRPDLLPLPLFRGNLLKKNFSSADMARGAASAGDWLVNNIEPTGRFTYNFNPTTGESSGFLDYNTVRHAGSVYSLMHLYNQSLEPRYLERGTVAVEFLKRHMKPPLLEPNLLAVRHPVLRVSELGSAALTLMALCELPPAQFEHIGMDVTNRLARFLIKMQLEDGNFHTIYMQKLAGLIPRKPVRYAPGEAMLALVRYYHKNPNVEWLESARRAAQNQIASFKTTGVPDNWTIQGLAELYRIDPEPRYAEVALAMADMLVKRQFTHHRFNDYVGGYDNSHPPRSTPAASRTEALIAVSNLCTLLGRDSKTYDEAILRAARFILWNQYRKENSYFIGLVEKSEGAIRGGLIDQNIRMDYCQHAIVALIGAYKLVTRLEESGAFAGSEPAPTAP